MSLYKDIPTSFCSSVEKFDTKMKYLKLLDTKDKEIIRISKQIIEQIVFFINVAVKNKRNIYVEYN